MQPTTYDIIKVNLSAVVETLHCTEMANTFNLWLNAAKNKHQKKLQIKVVQD